MTLTDPSKSLPALTECITQFGLISGYKVNFDKSEIMPLDNVGNGDLAYIKPFHWAPSGFNYLGIKGPPKIAIENINFLIKNLKDTLKRWKSLPITFLGRINLIKWPFFQKSMLFWTNDIKVLNKTMSDFIWAGRKSKIKLETLQLPKEQGGWGLPNIPYYILSKQAIIISSWVNEHSDSPWFNLQSVICKPFSPVNLFGKHVNELPHTAKNNLIIYVLWAWKKLKKIFNKHLSIQCSNNIGR